MADLTTIRRSPLAHLTSRMDETSRQGSAVALREEPFLAMVGVRAQPGSPAAERMSLVLGFVLPATCGEVAMAGGLASPWLGPDEWLVVSGSDPVALTDQLEAALGKDRGQVVDLSANRTVLELSGPAARRVLEKGCPVDLHPRSFGPGRSVSTTLARVPVVLWQTGESRYRLLPRSSYADYVARWLLDAMVEFHGPGMT